MLEISRFYGIIIREWAELHCEELVEMWETQNFHKIQPLE